MMKTNDFVIEILAEELPPKLIFKLAKNLSQQISAGLTKVQLKYEAIKYFATPRRLAVYVTALADATVDQIIEKKGPAKKAAFDANGEPTAALKGFASACGVTPEELTILSTPQGEWMAYKQQVPGKTLNEILPSLIADALATVPVPKSMRWGSGTVEFVRPVHSVLMLYGAEVIKTKILGCETGNKTSGHAYHAPAFFVVPEACDYENLLLQHYVMADFPKREAKIKNEILTQTNMQINLNEKDFADLLLEVTGLVEWPVILKGHIDETFLKLPAEVLIAAMKDHQRYFPLKNSQNNQFAAEFMIVSNIESKIPQKVIHGNERVLRARLSDAQFFYLEDLKASLASRLERLKHIVYQAKLGSLYDKAQRLSQLCSYIAKQLNRPIEAPKRAGLLAKCDLATHMVAEFPELQGIMGAYYAEHDQEASSVVTALKDQYLPRFAGDKLPEHSEAQILALADKIDLLVGSFSINQVPTGDKDPYGLRRAALGVLRILIEKNINLDLEQLFVVACDNYKNKACARDLIQTLLLFMQERLRAWYQETEISADIFASVAALQLKNPADIHARIYAVKAFKILPDAKNLSIANKRVSNILAKLSDTVTNQKIDASLFEHPAEENLAKKLDEHAQAVQIAYQAGEYQQVLQQLTHLREPIDEFFDHVMVMTDDQARRNNRIVMLKKLRTLFLQVADIALLQ